MQANTNMADNNNKRKSKRNFSLEKPVERHFDIEKEIDVVSVASATPVKPATGQQKLEVAPQKATSTPQGKEVSPTTPTSGNNGGDGGNNSMKWIVIALIVAAIAACAYFFMSGNKSDEGTDPQILQTEQNDSNQNGSNATDSIADSENEKEEGVAGEGNEAAGEIEENSQDESANVNEPVLQLSTSANNNQHAGISSVSQGTTSVQSTNNASTSSIEQKAKDVWKGVYGNNPDRRRNLGADYEAVQKLVNEMLRQGLN